MDECALLSKCPSYLQIKQRVDDFMTLGATVAEWLSSWLAEQEVRGCYLLLPSRDMAEIPLTRRKSSIQPTNFMTLIMTIMLKKLFYGPCYHRGHSVSETLCSYILSILWKVCAHWTEHVFRAGSKVRMGRYLRLKWFYCS